MKQFLIALTATAFMALAGCSHEPPSCDGGSRRPINEGRWDPDTKTSFGCTGGFNG